MSRFWNELVDVLRGNEQDFTKMRLRKAILLLSIPMVIEMLSEAVFALWDIFWLLKLKEKAEDAVAIVGITESLMTIIYAIGIGFAMATTGLVARRIGEKDYKTASKTAVQAIYIGITIAMLIALPGLLFPKELLGLMNTPAEAIESGYRFTQIMMAGNLVILLLFINNAIFRSAGDALTAMLVMLIANLINIVLDPCLIFGLGPFPELGVKGAAIATNIGRGTGVIIQFVFLFFGSKKIKLALNNLSFHFGIIKKLLIQSVGGVGQYLIATASWVFLYRIINAIDPTDTSIAAGYTISIRILILAILPAWGLSNAAATLVGQNLGAGNPQRAERAVWSIAWISGITLTLIGVGLIFTADSVVGFLTGTEQARAHEIAVKSLQILSLGYFFYATGMTTANAFNGAGDTITPTKINFVSFWIIEIPLAVLLALVLKWGEEGVFYSIVIAESLLGILGMIMFKRGKWKLKKV